MTFFNRSVFQLQKSYFLNDDLWYMFISVFLKLPKNIGFSTDSAANREEPHAVYNTQCTMYCTLLKLVSTQFLDPHGSMRSSDCVTNHMLISVMWLSYRALIGPLQHITLSEWWGRVTWYSVSFGGTEIIWYETDLLCYCMILHS